ncbi:hypothetical protein BC833DRAFT_605726 [Globomyces pollinis-pini]|nr:hypothetical protein BC833DRAFT_605726 [Globomyces pollinis-pini]
MGPRTLQQADCCVVDALVCENDRLTEINLVDSQLAGYIPPDIRKLDGLVKLDLQTNDITGIIPSEIGFLAKLQYLNLLENDFIGPIPSSILDLPYSQSFLFDTVNWSVAPLPLPTIESTVTTTDTMADQFTILITDLKLTTAAVTTISYFSSTVPITTTDLPTLTSTKKSTTSETKQLVSSTSIASSSIQTPIVPQSTTAIIDNASLECENFINDSYPELLGSGFPSISLSSCCKTSKLVCKDGHLSEIHLQNSGLNGKLTETTFSSFSYLTTIDLSNNSLTGAIPSSLVQLTGMKYLDLRSNLLTGLYPAQLKSSSFFDNFFFDSVNIAPKAATDCEIFFNTIYPKLRGSAAARYTLADCCNKSPFVCSDGRLKELLLNGGSLQARKQSSIIQRNLQGFIPPEIGSLNALTKLDLGANNLAGPIPPELGNLTLIVFIVLDKNSLSGPIPIQLGQLSQLTVLTLGENKLSGSIPPELGNLTKLQSLDLSGNLLTGPIPPSVKNLSAYSTFNFDKENVNAVSTATNIPFTGINDQNTSNSPPIVLIVCVIVAVLAIICGTLYWRYIRKKKLQRPEPAKPPAFIPNEIEKNDNAIHVRQPSLKPQIEKNDSSVRSTPASAVIEVNQELPQEMLDTVPEVDTFSPMPKSPTVLKMPLKDTETSSQIPNSTLSNTGTIEVVPSNLHIPPPINRQMANTSMMANQSIMYDMRLVIKKKMAGSGGCGQVFWATYAGKEAVAKIPFESEHEQMIYNESRIMKQLISPYIVACLTFMDGAPISIPGQPLLPRTALLLEFMNFGTFSTYLKPESPTEKSILVKSQTLALTIMAAKGLEFMHSKKLNHLDIKPENVLIHQHPDGSLVAKLSDFGSTLPEGSDTPVFQTPGFIPPEGKTQPYKTSKFDIYAFGCLIINVVTLANYAFMWEGSDKSWESKKEFLLTNLANRQLVDICMACINDEARQRPTMTQVLDGITRLTQEDFKTAERNVGNVSLMFAPNNTANNTANNTNTDKGRGRQDPMLPSIMGSELFRDTPGDYLLKLLDLRSPCKWIVFITSFEDKYQLGENFNRKMFEEMCQPKGNILTAEGIGSRLFGDYPSLGMEDDEEVWTEELEERIQKAIKKCSAGQKSNSGDPPSV